MKDLKIAYLFILCSLSLGISYAQWQTELRLSYTDSISATSEGSKQIASSDNYVHVVWVDRRFGFAFELFYRRSTDYGVTWGQEIRLTNDLMDADYPSIVVSGSVVHIVWQKYSAASIYYIRSSDNGTTWSMEVPILISPGNNFGSPYITASGVNVHIVWDDYVGSIRDIYYKHSTNSGVNWDQTIRLTNMGSNKEFPCIAASGSTVHVIWVDYRFGYPNCEILYKSSSDNGVTWGIDNRLTNDPGYSAYCDISATGNNVHIVWEDSRFENDYKLYYKRSTNGGLTWGPDTRLTDNFAEAISVVSSEQKVHIIWESGYDIFYKRSIDNGNNWIDSANLVFNGQASYPSISVSQSMVHVIWGFIPSITSNPYINYRRNPTGNTIGINQLSSESPSLFSLSQNYPNPFNPVTKILFDIPRSEIVIIKVYDMLGKEITTLVNQQLQAGTYETDWDASSYSSGIYYYKMISGNYSETKKMVLLK